MIRPATAADAEACAGVLRALPDFFTPNTHDEVRAAIATEGRAWVADATPSIDGFMLTERRSPRAAEITFAAVVPERRHQGIGRSLLATVVDELARDGVVVIEVKTLDASADYEPYVATRAFWERNGFVQIDCIDPLPGWAPGNPAAIYVRALTATG